METTGSAVLCQISQTSSYKVKEQSLITFSTQVLNISQNPGNRIRWGAGTEEAGGVEGHANHLLRQQTPQANCLFT